MKKGKLNQSKLFSAVEMDEERSCFVLKMLQRSWLLSQSSPAPCVFVWQHHVTMETGRLQGAGETHTVHCGAAVRAAICLCTPPVLGNSLGAIWGLYSSFAESSGWYL